MKGKRETAFKVRIKDILEGKYVVQEGWEPNYIELNSRRFSRVNLLGTYVGEENGLPKIDDGTGSIVLRSFEEGIKFDFNLGDILTIIGRPREYNQTRFIVPEIIRKIEDAEWIKVREIELKKFKLCAPVAEKKEAAPVNSIKIVDIVKEMDSGNGVSTEEVIKKAGITGEKEINKLLENGELFEIKPGILKVL